MNHNFRPNSTLDQNIEEKQNNFVSKITQVIFQVFYPRHIFTLYLKKITFFSAHLKKHIFFYSKSCLVGSGWLDQNVTWFWISNYGSVTLMSQHLINESLWHYITTATIWHSHWKLCYINPLVPKHWNTTAVSIWDFRPKNVTFSLLLNFSKMQCLFDWLPWAILKNYLAWRK